MKLKDSKVKFNEADHTYMLGKKQLMGITGLIHMVTGLGTYPSASEQVKNYNIPHAGARGTAVHSAIELYDTAGIFSDTFMVNWKEGDGTPHTEEFETAAALSGYIEAKTSKNAQAVANEYTVTDGEKWASNIDQIWSIDNGIVLVDTKTNNLTYYPGGADALKQYLSWQLSIYAYLFERQNKKIKVESLYCYWTDTKKWELWKIRRLSDELVEAILSVDYAINEDGSVSYICGDETKKKVMSAFDDTEIKEAVEKVADLQVQYKLIETKLTLAKLELLGLMTDMGMSNAENDVIKVSYIPASVSKKFDSTAFKKDNKDLYEKYTKVTESSDSLRITLKK